MKKNIIASMLVILILIVAAVTIYFTNRKEKTSENLKTVRLADAHLSLFYY